MDFGKEDMENVMTNIKCPPVLFLVFNRLDTTRVVFQSIREAKPSQLYIGSDGPRKTRENEEAKVKEVRDYILSNIDWDCKVETLFRNENLGCRNAVGSAIDWFFDQEEIGIILEDDCLPHKSFFEYCNELLDRYKDDTRIMCISGTNFKPGTYSTGYSYFFCEMPFIWGWATWRRAWNHFKKSDLIYYDIRTKNISFSPIQIVSKMWWKRIDRTIKKEIDTWDYLWTFTNLVNNGLTIIPENNLVKNIGLGHAQASNTMKVKKIYTLPATEMKFPLVHPKFIRANYKFERAMYRQVFNANPIWRRVVNKLLEIFGFR